jgi:mannose-6-phosphate isomerase
VTALEDTLVVEVATPHLDDVVRLQDRYGRQGTSEP